MSPAGVLGIPKMMLVQVQRRTGPGYARAGVAGGALFVSASAVLIDLSGTSPGTASAYRCALSLPVLALLARAERRATGASGGTERAARPGRGRLVTALAGALFAGDMLLWTEAIAEVGAGLSTVLVNAQVVIVPLLAWLVDREPLGRRFLGALPFLLAGVVLTGGVLDRGVSGSRPVLGTVHAVLAALCYSGFLFLLRRGGHGGQVIRSYRDVIATATVVSLVGGALWHGVQLAPGWSAVGWLALVAVTGQLLGWLMVAVCSPQLPGGVAAALLLLTPVGALALGAAVLGERPTPLQLAGCAVLLGAAYVASTGRGGDKTGGADETGATD